MTPKNTDVSFRKRCLKISLITLASLFAFIILSISIVINFVFSPQKLTPIVVDQASEYLNAQVDCKEVDLTFFSTFPQFGLRLTHGALISKAIHTDSLYTKQDSLLTFDEALVTLRPLAFFTQNKVKINRILFDNASVYAYINKEGRANWDIALPNDSTDQNDSMPSSSETTPPSIEIGKIEFKNTNLTFDDRQTEIYGNIKDLNISLKGAFSTTINDLDIDMETSNILFWQEGKTLINNTGCTFQTRLQADLSNYSFQLDKTVFDINGIKLGGLGSFVADTTTHSVDMNFHFGMHVPTLKTLLDLIPTSIVKEAVDVKADGSVKIEGSLKGVYGKEVMPVLDLIADIDHGKIQYKGMPYGIDRLDLNLRTHIDLQQKDSSYLIVNKFIFEGASSHLNLTASVEKPLTDPTVTSTLEAKINFTELAQTFPFEEGVQTGGLFEAKLNSKIRISDIERKDWGKLKIDGYLKSPDLYLKSEKDSFLLSLQDAGFGFGTNLEDKTILQGTNLLNAIIGFDKLTVMSRIGHGEIEKMALHLKTSPLKDTTAIASMQVTSGFKKTAFILQDSIVCNTGALKATIAVGPSERDKQIAIFRSELQFDSIYAATPSHRADLKNAGFSLITRKGTAHDKHWVSTGAIGFYSFDAYSAFYPLPIHMPSSKLTLEEDRVLLNRAAISIGKSNLTLSGSIENLTRGIFNNDIFYGKLTVQSDYIDCNQLIKASSSIPVAETDSMNTQPTPDLPKEATNDEDVSVFVIPSNVDFTLSTDIGHVKFGNLDITNILGDMTIRNQSIELSDLQLHTLAADMSTTMVYKAVNPESAYTGFDLKMNDIQVGRLIEAMPALDTLVPMLRSLDGKVNFRIAAEAQLKQDMMPDIPTIQAAAHVRGDSLVLMDGETFAEISKMLRFKNKDKNVIDSVSVDLLVNKGQIEIFPFLIRMDRYLAAVGGKHNIDMTYDYHVSLLDSPIPFKMGVNIKGNMDDFKFRLCKPKFKDLTKSARTSPVDSTGLTVRERIRRTLHTIER